MHYQHTSDLVEDKKGEWLADSHSVLNRRKNKFCQVLNARGVNDVTWKYV